MASLDHIGKTLSLIQWLQKVGLLVAYSAESLAPPQESVSQDSESV